jgi:hypothetical protein
MRQRRTVRYAGDVDVLDPDWMEGSEATPTSGEAFVGSSTSSGAP